MGALFVKMCGITTGDDALAADEAGADAVGFNFYPRSKRYIAPEKAADIIGRMPAGILRVGVFVNPSPGEVQAAINNSGINALQFSGNEEPGNVSGFGLPVMKAVHITDIKSIDAMKFFSVDSYLLDTFNADEFGGTGRTFDWSIAVQAKRFGRIVIAGGLTPENVAEAVRAVKPYGVDVSSGVELRPGIKDKQKVKDFILRAREAHSLNEDHAEFSKNKIS